MKKFLPTSFSLSFDLRQWSLLLLFFLVQGAHAEVKDFKRFFLNPDHVSLSSDYSSIHIDLSQIRIPLDIYSTKIASQVLGSALFIPIYQLTTLENICQIQEGSHFLKAHYQETKNDGYHQAFASIDSNFKSIQSNRTRILFNPETRDVFHPYAKNISYNTQTQNLIEGMAMGAITGVRIPVLESIDCIPSENFFKAYRKKTSGDSFTLETLPIKPITETIIQKPMIKKIPDYTGCQEKLNSMSIATGSETYVDIQKQNDPFWKVIAAKLINSTGKILRETGEEEANTYPRDAVITNGWNGWPQALPGSHWITPGTFSANDFNTFEIQHCFCLQPNFIDGIDLSLDAIADDGLGIKLNGRTVFESDMHSYSNNKAKPLNVHISDTTLFKEGKNCFNFIVYDTEGDYIGLTVSGKITTQQKAVQAWYPEKLRKYPSN